MTRVIEMERIIQKTIEKEMQELKERMADSLADCLPLHGLLYGGFGTILPCPGQGVAHHRGSICAKTEEKTGAASVQAGLFLVK